MGEVDLFGEPVINGHKSVLARTFEYPPFSVLSARDGWWQDRKRQWLALGIKSEVGRGAETDTMRGGGSGMMAFDNRHGLQTWAKAHKHD